MIHDYTSIEDLLLATLDAVSRFRVGQTWLNNLLIQNPRSPVSRWTNIGSIEASLTRPYLFQKIKLCKTPGLLLRSGCGGLATQQGPGLSRRGALPAA